MKAFLKRLALRAIGVALALGVIGYMLGQAFLFLVAAQGSEATVTPDAWAEWGPAVRMATWGVLILVVMDLIAFAIKRKRIASTTESSTSHLEPPPFPANAGHETVDLDQPLVWSQNYRDPETRDNIDTPLEVRLPQ